ncbi:Aldo/keto reductase [Xylariaceae sp. FL0594]|nr:Aldo/keto reductase [Xylariaceae sp. FL0594]
MPTPQLIFGGLNIGSGGFNNEQDVSELLAKLSSLGIRRIDTAATYPNSCPGLSEQLLGKCGAGDRGFVIDTKILATGEAPLCADAIDSSINVLYCHAPDPNTPMSETAAELDRQYKLGNFKILGLSNHTPAQISSFTSICEEQQQHNFAIRPSVVQGQYNMLFRGPEHELLPYLHSRGIPFIAYSPLAGGFLTGLFTTTQGGGDLLSGTRFEDGNPTGEWYKRVYDRPEAHRAVRELLSGGMMRLTELALRWLFHHSLLTDKDAVVLGASTIAQLEQNVQDIAKGPLPSDVLALVDEVCGVNTGE